MNNITFEDLTKIIFNKAEEKYGARLSNIIKKQINMELHTINEYGLGNKFIIAYEIARYAKDNEILLGPGRGMMAGSIVLYCLGVTGIYPVSCGLSSEMFFQLPDFLWQH